MLSTENAFFLLFHAFCVLDNLFTPEKSPFCPQPFPRKKSPAVPAAQRTPLSFFRSLLAEVRGIFSSETA